jgi:carbonic anhydrase
MTAVRRLLVLALVIAAPILLADEWSNLMRGNRRYVRGQLVYSHLRSQRNATRSGQHPPVTVISCADSRVPPELMFDQTVGDLFVVRVAGNVIDDFNLASVEYAAAHGWTKEIVVIGHESCGAVEAALSSKDPGSDPLRALVKKIRENINFDPDKPPPFRRAIELNARASAEQLRASKIIRDSKVPIVVAYYSLDGKVTKLGD